MSPGLLNALTEALRGAGASASRREIHHFVGGVRGIDHFVERGLIAQGCDLELEVLPIVAREIPDLPRPLKNWGLSQAS